MNQDGSIRILKPKISKSSMGLPNKRARLSGAL